MGLDGKTPTGKYRLGLDFAVVFCCYNAGYHHKIERNWF